MRFHLSDNLEETIRILALRAHEKHLRLRCEVKPDVPAWVVGDPHRLRQVIVNLIGNSIKFTEHGEVKLTVNVEAPDPLVLHFAVRDTGIGIEKSKMTAIFQPFSQADGSTTRKYGGTGLGLSICSHLVAAMQGKIWVDSEIGKGSCFHFTARFGVAHAVDARKAELAEEKVPEPRSGQAASTLNLRLLLTEDNPVNQMVAVHILEKLGHTVTVAENGREAMQQLASGEFDLILMDVQMPEMDGLEATEAIRRQEMGTGRHIPIIGMTAHAMTGDRERCLASGMDAYLSKPIHTADLRRLLEKCTEPASR